MKEMKYILFGTGDYYERYKKWFPKKNVLALLDNSPAKQNCCVDGIPVLTPQEGVRLPFDAVVMLSFYVKEMRQQLETLGVPEEKIYHFFDLHRLLGREKLRKPVRYYKKAEEIIQSPVPLKRKVLLLSQDLTLGGPAIALYHGARILKKYGFEVVYASMLDGPLRELLLSENIPVIIDNNLQIATMSETKWAGSFSLLVCNTIHFHVFLSDRDTGIPVIWWLHDSAFFYEGVNRNLLLNLDRRNLYPVSVGPVPREAMQVYLPDLPVKDLLYGVEDEELRTPTGMVYSGKSDKVRFVTIGYIEKRKGQDILIKAIKQLPKKAQEKSEFCFIGQDRSAMAQQLRQETKAMPEVRIAGVMDRQKIMDSLRCSDVLVCPSREDPMPTVAAEAMMNSVPCIVSDAAGTSSYIRNGTDGFLFESGNAEQLAERLLWCIEHREKLQEIGGRSRKIYEKYFAMNVFETCFLDLVEKAFEN